MAYKYLNIIRNYNMPLWITCENCKFNFVTRKRSNRVIRFCSLVCANNILGPQSSVYWDSVREKWKNESREVYIPIMKQSFEKFFDKVDGCWMWNGSNKGKRMPYGSFTFRGKRNQSAHRVSWIIYKGDIPEGMLVLHKCDVPQCVNPDHLFLGNYLDNERDKLLKGRHKGEKLNPEKVREIKSLFAVDYGDMKIARKFNVSYQTIYSIKNGKTWKDIF